jgi:pyridoxal phosphate enzyme (YggS family)
MMTLSNRIAQLRQSLPSQIRLIAVSKTVSVEKVRLAYEAGIRDFAESRLQEALPKLTMLSDLDDICWHFIGTLQANKARKILETFTWIHSVHNLAIAERLDRLATDLPQKPHICLQIKMLPDANKQGWSVPELEADLAALADCQHLNIQGLMAILPLGLTPEQRLTTFQATQELSQILSQKTSLCFTELSMGMSDDYLEAIAAGATMIRLGRIIFGDRESSDSIP